MNKYLLIPVVVVMIVGLILGGCAKPAPAPAPAPSPAPAPAPAPPAGPDEIRIGFPAPMTGDLAGFGQGLVYGAQAAADDINKQGGVYVKAYDRKLPITLIVVDEESDTIKTGVLTESLILQDKVHLLTTPDCPVFLQAPVCTVAERYKVPNVVGGGPMETWEGMRMDVTPPWQYSWFCGFAIATPVPQGDYRYGKPGYTLKDTYLNALDMYGDQTNRQVGVFASDDPDGRGWYELFPALLEDRGYTPVGIDKRLGLFPPKTTDFSSMIKKFQDNNVEVLLGNCSAPDFGTFWRQCHIEGFKPKMVFASMAGLFYTDVAAWGGNLPNGICCELWWSPLFECPGIGDTTPQSLWERWHDDTGEPLNVGIGHGYFPMQVLFDAVERAGTLDSDAVNKALSETDMMTINYRVQFDPETQVSTIPLFLGQWQKTDEPWTWDDEIVFSEHDFMPATAEMVFPVPYE